MVRYSRIGREGALDILEMVERVGLIFRVG